MTEDRESRLKKLRIRSWRRGTKEMDLLLGPYADAAIGALGAAELDAYERLLEENDQDLYAWISGVAPPAPRCAEALRRVAAFHGVG